MLVPSSVPHCDPWFGGSDEVMPTPGALTSGLRMSETGVGPTEEKLEYWELVVVAPTAIAAGAFAGESIEPMPYGGVPAALSFPAATTGTTPAAAAASSACTTMSRFGSISGSPSDRLITFIPSDTAASMPATISAEFPSRPSSGVGVVSTL